MKAIKILCYLGILVACIYTVVLFGRPQFKYRAFRSDVRELVGISIRNHDELKGKIMEKADYWGIPIKEDDIVVYGEDGGYGVKVSWTERVDLFGYYSKDYGFTVEASK